MALIWLYLQIIGAPVERLLLEKNLWSFNRIDFEKAAMFLILKNASQRDESALEMRELISKHFSNENDVVEWTKEITEKVNLRIMIL